MRAAAQPDTPQSVPVLTVGLVLTTPLLTRLRPRRLCRILSLVRPRARQQDTSAAVVKVDRALAIAGRVHRQTCFTRGISRFVVLRRAGLPVELVFGLGPRDGVYAGHCWLELDGAPYLEPGDPRELFPEILRVPAAANRV
jgi:transglutaminase-like putative cysteine protease